MATEAIQPFMPVDNTPISDGRVTETPVNLLNAYIKGAEDGGWKFGVGDPEFWNHSDKLVVPGGKVLDVGMGLGRTSMYFLLNGMKVTGYDSNPRAVGIMRDFATAYDFPLEVIEADIEEAQFGTEEYDTIILGQTLGHLRGVQRASQVLDSAIQALKPGGHIWIRTEGNESSTFTSLEEQAAYDPSLFKVEEYTFMNAQGTFGVFFPPIDLLNHMASRDMTIVHTQVLPDQEKVNIMYGEDWQGSKAEVSGLITIIARKNPTE